LAKFSHCGDPQKKEALEHLAVFDFSVQLRLAPRDGERRNWWRVGTGESERRSDSCYGNLLVTKTAAATPVAGNKILPCEKRSFGGELVRERASVATTTVTGVCW
jgi:hypothetical protein